MSIGLRRFIWQEKSLLKGAKTIPKTNHTLRWATKLHQNLHPNSGGQNEPREVLIETDFANQEVDLELGAGHYLYVGSF